MKRACFSVFMFGFLSLASPASATFSIRQRHLEHCTSQNPFDQGMCYGLISGYFEGMLDGLHLLESLSQYHPATD